MIGYFGEYAAVLVHGNVSADILSHLGRGE